MTKKTKALLKSLDGGSIPEVLHIIHWRDITQVEGCDLSHPVSPIEFMSAGLIVEKNKNYIKLQQSWEVKNDEIRSDKSANVVLLIPIGAIIKVFLFKYKVEK